MTATDLYNQGLADDPRCPHCLHSTKHFLRECAALAHIRLDPDQPAIHRLPHHDFPPRSLLGIPPAVQITTSHTFWVSPIAADTPYKVATLLGAQHATDHIDHPEAIDANHAYFYFTHPHASAHPPNLIEHARPNARQLFQQLIGPHERLPPHQHTARPRRGHSSPQVHRRLAHPTNQAQLGHRCSRRVASAEVPPPAAAHHQRNAHRTYHHRRRNCHMVRPHWVQLL